jgi:hypothetical protein
MATASKPVVLIGTRVAVWVLVVIVMVEVTAAPPGVTVAGLKMHVELAGSPEQTSCRAMLNPPIGVIVRAAEPDPPWVIVNEVGLAEIEKSGVITASLTAADVAPVKFVSPG